MHPSPHTKQLAIALLTAPCHRTIMANIWEEINLNTDVWVLICVGSPSYLCSAIRQPVFLSNQSI